MRRSPMPPRHTRAKRKTPPSRNRTTWTEVRQIVYARAGFHCDLCGFGLHFSDMHCHHRLLRKHGGKDDPIHCVALHPHCHDWVHAHPRQATLLGFICPFWREPDIWPVRLHKSTWVLPVEDRWVPSAPHFDQEIGAET